MRLIANAEILAGVPEDQINCEAVETCVDEIASSIQQLESVHFAASQRTTHLQKKAEEASDRALTGRVATRTNFRDFVIHKNHVNALARRVLQFKREDGDRVELSHDRQIERWLVSYRLWHESRILGQINKEGVRLNEELQALETKFFRVNKRHEAAYIAYAAARDEQKEVEEKARLMKVLLLGPGEEDEEADADLVTEEGAKEGLEIETTGRLIEETKEEGSKRGTG